MTGRALQNCAFQLPFPTVESDRRVSWTSQERRNHQEPHFLSRNLLKQHCHASLFPAQQQPPLFAFPPFCVSCDALSPKPSQEEGTPRCNSNPKFCAGRSQNAPTLIAAFHLSVQSPVPLLQPSYNRSFITTLFISLGGCMAKFLFSGSSLN